MSQKLVPFDSVCLCVCVYLWGSCTFVRVCLLWRERTQENNNSIDCASSLWYYFKTAKCKLKKTYEEFDGKKEIGGKCDTYKDIFNQFCLSTLLILYGLLCKWLGVVVLRSSKIIIEMVCFAATSFSKINSDIWTYHCNLRISGIVIHKGWCLCHLSGQKHHSHH